MIDTSAGEVIPDGAPRLAPTTRAQANAMRRATAAQAAALVSRNHTGDGESPIIAPDGHFTDDHGFSLLRLDLEAAAALPTRPVDGIEVIFVHSGDLVMSWPDGQVALGEGDTLTVPTGVKRTLSSVAGTTAFIVRGPAGA